MKKTVLGRTVRRAAIALAALGMMLDGGSVAMAASYGSMSCYQLWYARNAIYAAQGYCFKTARAIAVFGPRCYPPYGRLTASQQRAVNDITYWERRKGCA